MKSAEFISQYGPTLKEKHLDWLTALKDESMSDVWENTNDPQILIEILRCLLNSNYDTALNEYLRDALLIFENQCKSDLYQSLVARSVGTVQDYLDGKFDESAMQNECLTLYKEMIAAINTPYEVNPLEKAAVFATSFCINWLVSKSETSAVFAAYHATEHLVRVFHQDEAELSEKIRGCVGNPFA